jgi:ABC-type amino acid transport substrate-binding protein
MRLTTLVLFLAGFTTAFAQQRDFVISGVPFYPFHYMQDGKPAGIFVEYVNLIFPKIGTKHTTLITDAAGFDRVKQGKVDAVMSVGYSREREDFMIYPEGFSSPDAPKNYVWISSYHFFTLKENEQKYQFKTLAELKAKNPVIGVIKGISYSPEFWDAGFIVKELETNEAHLKALQDKKIDLFLIDKTVGTSIIKRDGLKNQIVSLPNVVFKRHYTLVLSKASNYPGKEDVLRKFFEEYNRLKVTADIQGIFLKYTN